MAKYFGLNKWLFFFEIVKHNGGWWRSFYKTWIQDELKIGKHMGTDWFGNKYYENDRYFFGRNRWVEYSPHVRLEYDASMICPEWYSWLHNKTDLIPSKEPFRPKYDWMLRDTENYTGTPRQYVPYSTRNPKIHAWRPPRGDFR